MPASPSPPVIKNAPLLVENKDARRLWLSLQCLSEPPRKKMTAPDLTDLIERLGYVQLDSIQTVMRAHHSILFSRNQTYRPKMLERLISKDRALFENWTHDAAIIPTAFYPHWRLRFAREQARLRARYRDWHGGAFEGLLDEVLGHIEAKGPTRSRDLGPEEPRRAQGWWDWHPAKTALEFLWLTGSISITKREGFQKVYDLSERVIPNSHRLKPHDAEESLDWACREALKRLGFAGPGEIAAYFDLISTSDAKAWCEAHLGKDVVKVAVAPKDGSRALPAFALANIEERLASASPVLKRLRFLSPFDPVIRNRGRLQRLFDFDYRIEVFVPAPKRRYGYYVFPILEGDRFVGRIDMKRDDKTCKLAVQGLWWEDKVKASKGRLEATAAELARWARFCGMEHCDPLG